MKYYTKVVIKSLSHLCEPFDSQKCGTHIQNFYAALENQPNKFNSLKMSVVRHNHHKAVIKFSCDNPEDFVAIKEYFYRYYADKFTWKGLRKLWLAK